MKAKQNQSLISLTTAALCVALISISSYFYIPLPFTAVAITAQTLFINLTALLLTPRQTLMAVGAYILLGVCGLPVFAGGGAGVGVLFGPTGGFIFGFLAVAPLISLLKGREVRFWRYLLATCAFGMPAIYLFGSVFLSITGHMSLWAALMGAVVPFIAGDLVKCLAASLLAVALSRALRAQPA
jgi:biotin transport system substrate-specific component